MCVFDKLIGVLAQNTAPNGGVCVCVCVIDVHTVAYSVFKSSNCFSRSSSLERPVGGVVMRLS